MNITRRQMLKSAALGGAWVLLGRSLERFVEAADAKGRPNILLKLTDFCGGRRAKK